MYLKGDHVSCNGGEMVVPQPADGLLAGFDAGVGEAVLRVILLPILGHGIPVPDHTHADKENIALLELDALVFGNGIEIIGGGDVLAECIVLDVLLLRPASVVEEDATTSDALLRPLGETDPCADRVENILAREIFEELPGDGGRPVTEAVPLRTLLRVEGVHVIECWVAFQGDDIVLECGATESGGIELAEVPIEAGRLAVSDFLHRTQAKGVERLTTMLGEAVIPHTCWRVSAS